MTARRHGPRPLGSWDVEVRRLVRTGRGLGLVVAFAFFGLAAPLVTRYLNQLVGEDRSAGISLSIAAPVPADGISGSVQSALQLGALVTVAVAAAAGAIDNDSSLSVFYRTRNRSQAALWFPRFAVSGLAAVLCYWLGLLLAWYSTRVLIGPIELAVLVKVAVAGGAYLIFAAVLAAAAGAILRSASRSALVVVGLLIALPIAGGVGKFSTWLPTELPTLAQQYASGEVTEAGPAFATTILASFALLGVGLGGGPGRRASDSPRSRRNAVEAG